MLQPKKVGLHLLWTSWLPFCCELSLYISIDLFPFRQVPLVYENQITLLPQHGFVFQPSSFHEVF